MAPSNNQRWPANRFFHRYRMQLPVDVSVKGSRIRGLCRDIGLGGACITLAADLAEGEEVMLAIILPGLQDPLRIQAVVRNRRGDRYGLQFPSITSRDRERITNFGRDSAMSAFLFTPDADIVRSAQQSLQDLGVTQVWRGCPDSFPVLNPHLIIIDSDWPDFVEVAQLLRSEGEDSRIIVVGLLDPQISGKAASEMQADIILHKPLPRNWMHKVLGTAVNLLSGCEATKGLV